MRVANAYRPRPLPRCGQTAPPRRGCAPSDKNQLSENRLQQFGSIYEELEIRVGHESPVADAPSPSQQVFARARVHPE